MDSKALELHTNTEGLTNLMLLLKKKAGGSMHTILNLIFKKLKSILNNSILLGNTRVVRRNGWERDPQLRIVVTCVGEGQPGNRDHPGQVLRFKLGGGSMVVS